MPDADVLQELDRLSDEIERIRGELGSEGMGDVGHAEVHGIGSHIPRHKNDATAAPTTSDDSSDGYGVGSTWDDVTNDKSYRCVDATVGAAVWIEVSPDHTKYTDAEAVAAVEAEDPLDLAGVVKMADGSAAAPVLTFTLDPDTGLFRVAVDTLGIATGGVQRWQVDPNGALYGVMSAASVFGTGVNQDLILAINAVEKARLNTAGKLTLATGPIGVDSIVEQTLDAGVTVDGVLLQDGVVAVGDVAFDDVTSDPVDVDATAAFDGIENSVARKDHRHKLGLLHSVHQYEFTPDAGPQTAIVTGDQQGSPHVSGPSDETVKRITVICETAPASTAATFQFEYGDTEDLDTVTTWTEIDLFTHTAGQKTVISTAFTNATIPARRVLRFNVDAVGGTAAEDVTAIMEVWRPLQV